MASLASGIVSVLRDQGWTVTQRSEVLAKGLSFDFICESQAAIVFGKEVAGEELEESAKRLSAEVASVTQRRSIGAKTWEGYLLLLCEGDLTAHEKAVQSVQHDLAYCRKIVIPATDMESASDAHLAAQRFVGFLLPLRPSGTVPFADVRQALTERLEANGVAGELAAELVSNFDEGSCRCGQRIRAFSLEHQQGAAE